MRKTFLILILILLVSLFLGGCAYRTPLAPQETFPAEVSTQTASPVAQTATQPATPAQTGEGTAAPGVAVNGCTVESPFPTPGPTEQALLPPPGEGDWVKGPATASTTLTEYSDFQ